MSRLIKIANWSGPLRASVIFVHGLGGHPYGTWRRKPDNDTFWPLWLAQDVPGISVYSVAYEAPPTNWLGTSMPLQDRAVNISEQLFSEPDLKSGPVVFVCHSLGGLIVKQIMLDLQQQKERRPEAADLLARVREIVFAATPHTGSRHATLLDRLRFFAWPSWVARTLVANDPTLRSINVAYRGLADERRGALQHRVFYETQDTPLGVIVDEASADPGLPGDPPVPIDANHINIVKLADRSSLLYARTKDFVAKLPASVEKAGALEILTLPDVKSELPLNPIPKLIRLAAVGLIGVVGYKGVQGLIAPPPPIEQIQQPLVDQLATKDAQIAALTEALTKLNPSAAGPGAQQAVGGAVQSIVQGAEQGDRRLQQALDLLKDNKVGEASQLLAAVARDRTARAEQAITQAAKDRKEAAIAYRNLGAIAKLRDPKSALEAYEKAVSLDPDDIESLLGAGMIEIDHGDLSKAQTRLERVLSMAQNSNQPNYEQWARIGLGEIRQKRGALPDALKSYRDSLAIAERLAKEDPGNAEWQRDLSVSYEKVGNVQVAQGALPDALKSFRESLAIAERLAKADPGNAEWQRDLSVSYQRVGDVQVAQGALADALKSYRDSLAIFERLAKAAPGNAGWQRDLSVSYNKVGDVQVAQGALPDALKSYRDSLAIMERLAKAGPSNAEWQRDLSVSHAKLANAYRKSDDATHARGELNAGRAIIKKLIEQHPDWAQWKQDLAWFEGQLVELDAGSPQKGNKPTTVNKIQKRR